MFKNQNVSFHRPGFSVYDTCPSFHSVLFCLDAQCGLWARVFNITSRLLPTNDDNIHIFFIIYRYQVCAFVCAHHTNKEKLLVTVYSVIRWKYQLFEHDMKLFAATFGRKVRTKNVCRLTLNWTKQRERERNTATQLRCNKLAIRLFVFIIYF